MSLLLRLLLLILRNNTNTTDQAPGPLSRFTGGGGGQYSVIGQYGSRDLITGLWLVSAHKFGAKIGQCSQIQNSEASRPQTDKTSPDQEKLKTYL